MPKLPRDVELYLSRALKGVDWAALKAATPDLCHDCPQYYRDQDTDHPVCLACPWWGVLYSHMQAQHWRGDRHLRRIAKSRGDAPDHD